jgi:23S rRNA (pseudouridine1915-N3)-methyltransferase
VGRSAPRQRSGSALAGGSPIRFRLLAVGKLRNGPLKELQDLYARRIAAPVTIVEIEERRRFPTEVLKAREAELILGALPSGSLLFALDENGATCSSRPHRRLA